MDNKDGRVVDPAGHPLPPCIIMERGESLDIWSQRAKPDRMQSFSVRIPVPHLSIVNSLCHVDATYVYVSMHACVLFGISGVNCEVHGAKVYMHTVYSYTLQCGE